MLSASNDTGMIFQFALEFVSANCISVVRGAKTSEDLHIFKYSSGLSKYFSSYYGDELISDLESKSKSLISGCLLIEVSMTFNLTHITGSLLIPFSSLAFSFSFFISSIPSYFCFSTNSQYYFGSFLFISSSIFHILSALLLMLGSFITSWNIFIISLNSS